MHSRMYTHHDICRGLYFVLISSLSDFSAVKLLLGGTVPHFLYTKRARDNTAAVVNVHPFLDEATLLQFFNTNFGEVIRVDHHRNEATAAVRFRNSKALRKLLSNPMKKLYSIDLSVPHLPGKLVNWRIVFTSFSLLEPSRCRNMNWLQDYQLAKEESETVLESYFKDRLSRRRVQEDDDGWITVDKKHRF
ncbi:hypothetical protein FBUS_01344 [Fasciolopsis buskii]|uniref:RRM domain-containing protein n=1 Tax=Fasciolopsis buskii TaxID=27845 RepID=A0A8E0S358_9TREM|nr:hypothetical protein FBUS_01344 [Fasciolopsis buski]